jgi:hypothetical protein
VAVDVYATLPELKARWTVEDSIDDALITAVLLAASRSIDVYCGRRFWQDSAVQTRTYQCDDSHIAWVDDISTTTGLVIKTDPNGDYTWTETWDTTDYDLEPGNADTFQSGDRTQTPVAWWRIVAIDDKTFPVSERRKTLQVTAKFGWSAVPAVVKEATILKAMQLFKRKDAVYGALGIGDFGVRISQWEDPHIAMMLDPLRRMNIGAV